jgi:hypothetical protein
MKGFNLNYFEVSNLITTICTSLIAINLIGLLLAWPMAKYIVYLYAIKMSTIMYFLLLLLLLLLIYEGYTHNSLNFYLLSCIGLLPITYLLRNIDTTPLVFAFLIQDPLLDNILRLPALL